MKPGFSSIPAVPKHPALAPWCRVVEDGNRMLFEHGGTVVTLEGRATRALLPRLLPLLDGTRTADEIGAAIGAPAAPAVEKALALLAANQLLLEGEVPPDVDGDRAAAAAFAAVATRRTGPAAAVRALAGARVAVVGSGAQAAEVARQLDRAGIGDVAAGEACADTSDLVVAVPAAGEQELLRSVNRRCLDREQAWLQVPPYDGRLVVVGPLFLPGASACHTCYRLRRGACSGYEEDAELFDGRPIAAASPRPLEAVAAGLAAVLAIRWLATADPTLPGVFYAFEPGAPVRLSTHRALRVPRCPDCGPPERAMTSPWFAEPR